MKASLISGSISGLLIVLGEGVLNGVLLSQEWATVNNQLGLSEPSQATLTAALLKLFVLGFVVIWLYKIFVHRYSKGFKSGLYAGLTVGFLIWCWALSGLWLAGYINTTIALVTLPWGLLELGTAGVVGGLVYEKLSTT